ncbi:tyrosine-type recombinase/integrase [Achromobacter xylosoxidans]|uniref:tyrosine-type recombinase/integrase n=1 Tax=Alcaligenes xylosoxydans xylosoxydans TaxID=85698 RepID=UPI0012AA027F|nr:tyrosine-type recombinase/integrase [Achromobacter xylosoxidans]MDC6163995.1 tyrosine-type recombinase/integrase [Achromobacter xylosoxidans]CUR64708.1 tyrosine recombinase XerC [Achromobacter xylosoxidans]
MKPWTRRQPRRKPAPTLAEALARYLLEVSATKKGHTSEQSIARIWRATRLAIRPVDRIRSSDLTELRDEWLKDRAPATVVRRMAFLSHVYTVIRKDWGFDQLANPVQLVRRPAVDDARDRRLFDRITLRGLSEDDCPRKELEWIIRATRSAELPTILTVAKETGMRRSEVVGIQREHLDLMHGVVHLPHTKNGRARDVPLTPRAREALRRWVTGKPMRGRIFAMQPGSVTRAFIRARRRARSRYEGTSQLATVFQIHELAKVNGNVDTRMLLRYYHPHGRELAQKLARSQLGRRQLEEMRREREVELDTLPLAA